MSASDWPVEVDPILGCWLWTGKTDDRDGSGIIWRGKHPVRAYIVVYSKERAPIADGMVHEHLCKRRRCVAPHHLEVVTQRENMLRKSWRYRVRIRRCPEGHDLTNNGVVTPEGGRVCRECNRVASHDSSQDPRG